MWGKMGLHRSRKPTIGDPTLLDKTLDESQYRYMSPISSLQHGESSYSTSSSSPAPQLPNPSFNSNPAYRVPSSIYSRDTMVDHLRQPDSRDTSYPSLDQSPSNADISPPDSPISIPRRPGSHDSGQISPVEDEPKQTPTGPAANKFTSHLPILRKRAGSEQPDAVQRERRQTRWDDFSGEPTTNDSGKFSQAAPGSHAFQGPAPPHPRSSSANANTNIFGWSKDQFLPRRKFSDTRSPPAGVREPWKGPSGRSPMVAPIQERPRARSSSRVRLSRSNDRLKGNEYKTPESAPFSIVPSVVTTITAGEGNPKRPQKSPGNRDNRQIPQVPEEPTPPSSAHSPAPPRVDLPQPDLTATLADLKLTNEDETGQPVSRFSATTDETTETGSSTASAPDSIDTASDTRPSIMSRKRPVPSAVAPVKQTSRKPTPAEMSGMFGTSKELPQCPPEQQAQNRVEMLEARRDGLARRRANIDTIIHELTQVIQPSPIAYDMAAREEVKKTVDSLNNELAEIKREEHEIGVKLLRAWKKRDEQDYYGGSTSIWVKRVTS
ncbi:hypothetical protein BDV59DRAFT_82357 [Aspergillus ambiguus]|uniref:uncharacterized protein n=1 Tax=Aspergillus ambiguus TaxID=176160 RepID=UPI003CCD2E07